MASAGDEFLRSLKACWDAELPTLAQKELDEALAQGGLIHRLREFGDYPSDWEPRCGAAEPCAGVSMTMAWDMVAEEKRCPKCVEINRAYELNRATPAADTPPTPPTTPSTPQHRSNRKTPPLRQRLATRRRRMERGK